MIYRFIVALASKTVSIDVLRKSPINDTIICANDNWRQVSMGIDPHREVSSKIDVIPQAFDEVSLRSTNIDEHREIEHVSLRSYSITTAAQTLIPMIFQTFPNIFLA
jgi:hypothetical protein